MEGNISSRATKFYPYKIYIKKNIRKFLFRGFPWNTGKHAPRSVVFHARSRQRPVHSQLRQGARRWRVVVYRVPPRQLERGIPHTEIIQQVPGNNMVHLGRVGPAFEGHGDDGQAHDCPVIKTLSCRERCRERY